jgi:hypothetical protein
MTLSAGTRDIDQHLHDIVIEITRNFPRRVHPWLARSARKH